MSTPRSQTRFPSLATMKNRYFPKSSLVLLAITYATALQAQSEAPAEQPSAPPAETPDAPSSEQDTTESEAPAQKRDASQESSNEIEERAPSTTDSAESASTEESDAKVEAPAQDAGGEAQAAPPEPTQLQAVVVSGAALSTSDEAEDKAYEVPGGVNLIRSEDLSKGTLGTVSDVLKNQPGVYAESVNGGEATRLSIRGSGIVRSGFLFGWGNVLNLDGQRLYGASGNPYEAIEPLAVDHVEVLRGANAFEYGPLSIGGSINYVTKTGYDASPFYARFEAGSYGYFREQISSGDVIGPLDYYLSITRFDKEGFRNNTQSHSTRILGNVGYQFSSKLNTRFHFRFAEQYQEDAGFLTLAQLREDPKQSQFTDIRPRENPGTVVIGNSTNYQIDDQSRVEFGIQYDDSPINTSRGGLAHSFFTFQQISGSLRYKRDDELFGRRSKTQAAFIAHQTVKNNWRSRVAETLETAATRPADQGDWTLLATNATNLFGGFWLDVGVAGIYQTRKTSVTEGQNLVGQSISQKYFNVVPKLAARYEITPTAQVYANLSQAIDAPSSNSLIRTDAFFIPQEFLALKETKSTSFEVGTKGQGGPDGIFDWNISYYRSWIKDELLSVQIAPQVVTASNATPTIHQGVEAGLAVRLWRHESADAEPGAPAQEVVLRHSYTWNDFYFENDPLFGQNKLAGVPVHLLRVELSYEHPSGFYAGVNATSSPAEFAIDFANTIYNPTYTLLGARVGYQQPKDGLEIFLEGRNLLNERYSAVVAPIFNANGADLNVYSPGEGLAVNGGIAWRY